jgi:V/A-type H+-transporting ATPase subunit D
VGELRGVPPGRAGWLWLRRRLAAADRAATLLDRKLRMLRAEHDRLGPVADRARRSWVATCATADRWLTRAAVVGGERGIRLATGEAEAEAELTWVGLMGARYPAAAVCQLPGPADGVDIAASAALPEAVAAHRAAVRAGVEYAVVAEAVRVVDAEAAATRRRLRVLTDRYIPRLVAALDAATQRLAEAERAEAVRTRWAAAGRPAGGRTDAVSGGTDQAPAAQPVADPHAPRVAPAAAVGRDPGGVEHARPVREGGPVPGGGEDGCGPAPETGAPTLGVDVGALRGGAVDGAGHRI